MPKRSIPARVPVSLPVRERPAPKAEGAISLGEAPGHQFMVPVNCLVTSLSVHLAEEPHATLRVSIENKEGQKRELSGIQLKTGFNLLVEGGQPQLALAAGERVSVYTDEGRLFWLCATYRGL